MTRDFQIVTLVFGSLLSYSPHGGSDEEKKSKTVMKFLKNDFVIGNPPADMSIQIARGIRSSIATLPFSNLFNLETTLIPVPNSTFRRPGSLWVPQRIADALVANRLGKNVENCVNRFQALRKSATSLAKDRPTALQHYDSVRIERPLHEPKEILLVDDVVTRGATLIGIANKLIETFPAVPIRAFAAMRTICSPHQFRSTYDPWKGKIDFINGQTFRDPSNSS